MLRFLVTPGGGASRHQPTMGTHTVVMVRNGSCEWNEQNLFPGWCDTELSEVGKTAARQAGEELKKAGYQFDVAFTSVLTRAHETLYIILDVLRQSGLPVYKTWRLNERHYGALTGQNRAEMSAKYGEDQVRVWRRSYDVAPPPMRPHHPCHRNIVENPVYVDGPDPKEFPDTESLRITIDRTLPFWTEIIVPRIKAGERVLICAHGNSLRGLVKHLEDITDHGVTRLSIPMCIPFVYELDSNMVPVAPLRFLAEEDVLMDATEAIDAQIATPK